MNSIVFAFNVLLCCLIVSPFVCIVGTILISVYFTLAQKQQAEKATNFVNALIKSGKAASNESKKSN